MGREALKEFGEFFKPILFAYFALFAGLIDCDICYGHGKHLEQPPGVVRLQSPWSKWGSIGEVRYPRSYIKKKEIEECEPQEYLIDCVLSLPDEPFHYGHSGDSLFGAVDLPTANDWDEVKANWPIRAAHSGMAKFKIGTCRDEPQRVVTVTNQSSKIRTVYTHLRFPSDIAKRVVNVGDEYSRWVQPGEIIGYSTSREQGDACQGAPHLHFKVRIKKEDGTWKQVDLRNVKLDGQPLFENCIPAPFGTKTIQYWCNPITSYEGLTQAEAGATNEENDQFGFSVATGDFNGDGKDDLAVGVPNEDDEANDDGIVIVYYGSILGITPGFERLGQGNAGATGENGDRFGSALAVGDFNGDGKDDLAVGVPDEDDEATDDGMVVVFYGSADGLLPVSQYERLGQEHAGATGENGDRFGSALAVGDFNGNGKDDLAVGVPDEDDKASNDGMVIVFYGSADGLLPVSRYERLSQKQVGAKSKGGDRFGSTLVARDFNGNGKEDLAVGVPGEDDEASDEGMVVVFYGHRNGLIRSVKGKFRAFNYERLGQQRGGGIKESGDQFGLSLGAGDFSADGEADLAVGTPLEDIVGEEDAGTVYIYDGSSVGFIP